LRFRLYFAWTILILSLVGGSYHIYMYQTDQLSTRELVFHTLILSWLAITFTCYDILTTTDVRKQQED